MISRWPVVISRWPAVISRWMVFAASLPLLLPCVSAPAEDVRPIGDAAFAQLHRLIKRQPGESRWMEIDWHPSVWEGRRKAAAEGKPIFLMAGSGGAPAAGC